MTPQEARDYISRFHLVIGKESPITFVETSAGRRIDFATMSDEDAVQVAQMMQDMEIEAGKPQGVPVQ